MMKEFKFLATQRKIRLDGVEIPNHISNYRHQLAFLMGYRMARANVPLFNQFYHNMLEVEKPFWLLGWQKYHRL